MRYIYVDVLLILNLYVNYFLLRATGRLMHLPCRRKRCIAAAVAGSLCSLTILLMAQCGYLKNYTEKQPTWTI